MVRALECNSVREGRGDVPNATGNGGTVARATDDWGSPGKRMGGTKGVELARAENGKEAVVDGGKMAERAAVVGEKRPAVVEASGEGRRGCGRGQQGAKKVAGAEVEAVEVAGRGSKNNESRRSRGTCCCCRSAPCCVCSNLNPACRNLYHTFHIC